MEFALEPDIWLVLSVVAFIAGFIDAIAGGGGLLTIPALLTSGLPPHLALGTNKLAATFGSATASFTFYKKQLFKPQIWITALFTTFVGALLGTFAVHYLDPSVLDKGLPMIVLATAVYTLFSKRPNEEEHQPPTNAEGLKTKQTFQGFTLGFYDGFAGPGTGAFWTVSNMAIYKLNILWASGMAKAMNFVSNATSLAAFIYLGHVNWLLGVSMGVCIMAGAFLGAHSAIRFGANFIRPIFISVVIVIAAKLAWEAWL
ncbi:sulfite exporter TauE/SafE family protein [Paraferrimonas sedimenticola]|uniref:Probable membrane transporter protein n=1 Tax=Paraferrimonas sedimenticola TaxID=375674 RepID=A0AA37RXH9_9GAMM|nr:TSUP family transporter [Paraferrimonas sedimenticola]GLP96931.1 UPF0721 transmembrane protein [Paraferrimonas sedimenticola]